MSVPEHKIRTAIKAYSDAGGGEDFYILSKSHVRKHYLDQDQITLFLNWIDMQLDHTERIRQKNFYPLNEQTPEKLDLYNKANTGRRVLLAVKKEFEKIRDEL